MISERIFNIPGLGLLLYNAIVQNDYIMVQSGAIVTAVIICVMNLITVLPTPLLIRESRVSIPPAVRNKERSRDPLREVRLQYEEEYRGLGNEKNQKTEQIR